MFRSHFLYLLACLSIACIQSCEKSSSIVPIDLEEEVDVCIKYSIDSSFVINEAESTFLKAGGNGEKFDVSDSNIDLCKLNQGLGREFFPALYDPQYLPIVEFQYGDDMRCVIIKDETTIKVYPYSLLSQHETINEQVGDEPVMVVFCELAELAAVYTRKYCGQVFTFAPSGYTYFDDDYWDGVQGILLWDRETESLWWPLNDKGMSGMMKDVGIKKAPFQLWETMSWGEIKQKHPEAISVAFNQVIEVPSNLPMFTANDLTCQ